MLKDQILACADESDHSDVATPCRLIHEHLLRGGEHVAKFLIVKDGKGDEVGGLPAAAAAAVAVQLQCSAVQCRQSKQ